MDSDHSDPAFDETIAADAGSGGGSNPKLPSTPTPVTTASAGTSSERIGTRIGRYLIKRKLGRGGYGDVYLAEDESLRRPVALKVINRGSLGESREELLEEGRTLAQLDHAGIVSVFDVGVIEDEAKLYFVSQFVEGWTLRQAMREGRIDCDGAASLIATLAEALSYAHARSIVHRDIKPTNIIITEQGDPVLIDFGIAWTGGGQTKIEGVGAIIGSIGYMSPEQARGESHLVDGRSDIYSLGVILYEILSGKLPFEGRTEDVIEQVSSSTLEVCPPRQIDASIPRAIERVCLKALAKRTADRYSTAEDLAEDLRAFADSASQEDGAETKTFRVGGVIPKGLRSFDGEDADFFLQLLPGLRDQAGIPDGILFWKRGIENRADPFRVGVLYGPSGSGKSSFLKAGLLPLLPEWVEVIYVAADSVDAEARLRQRLHERFSEFDADMSATDCLRQIRERQLIPGGGKLLIAIDQFEQWLHSNDRTPESDMVSALRQCDGESVQVLLTVRDDFWMAIGQLMNDIDVNLLQSRNTAAIDLFDQRHARNVLIAFGSAFERLPGGDESLSEENHAFIDAAIEDMQQDGKIIPLQLSLFAEMAKSVPWTEEAYRRLGGATAIGVEFLNSVFSSSQANPAHRAVEKPARAILEALLPPGDEKIRGRAVGVEQLRERAGLTAEAERFATTLRILDSELKLISPVDIADDGSDRDKSGADEAAGERQRRYQLTHDYLVPALRDWLFESRKATISGRCLLRLKELAAAWRLSGDRRHLPSLGEWVGIHALVPKAGWDAAERRLMATARRVHLRRVWLVAGLLVVAALAVGMSLRRQASSGHKERLLATPVANGIAPTIDAVPVPHRVSVLEQLGEDLATGELSESETLVAHLVLAENDSSHAAALFKSLPDSTVASCPLLCDRIGFRTESLLIEAWKQMDRSDLPAADKLRYATLLARADTDSQHWPRYSEEVAQWILLSPRAETEQWSRNLSPIRDYLLPLFKRRLIDSPSDAIGILPGEAHAVAVAVTELGSGNGGRLLELFFAMPDEEVGGVAAAIEGCANAELLDRVELVIGDAAMPLKDRARAAALHLRLDEESPHWALLTAKGEVGVRRFLIQQLPLVGVGASGVFEEAKKGSDIMVRQSLIQSLGNYNPNDLPPVERREMLQWMSHTFADDPDPAVHASAQWALSAWGEKLPQLEAEDRGDRRWLVNKSGMSFSVVHSPRRLAKKKEVAPVFAIGMTEVTAAHYLDVLGDLPVTVTVGDHSQQPVTDSSLNDAMQFCILLTRKEGIAESEQCYRPVEGGYAAEDGFFEKSGYRLASLTEWKLAARGDSGSRPYVSETVSLADSYAWHVNNRDESFLMRVARLKPNSYGLFDSLGNVGEWCHEPSLTVDRAPRIIAGFVCGDSVRAWPDKLSTDAPFRHGAESRHDIYGLRVVRTLPGEAK